MLPVTIIKTIIKCVVWFLLITVLYWCVILKFLIYYYCYCYCHCHCYCYCHRHRHCHYNYHY